MFFQKVRQDHEIVRESPVRDREPCGTPVSIWIHLRRQRKSPGTLWKNSKMTKLIAKSLKIIDSSRFRVEQSGFWYRSSDRQFYLFSFDPAQLTRGSCDSFLAVYISYPMFAGYHKQLHAICRWYIYIYMKYLSLFIGRIHTSFLLHLLLCLHVPFASVIFINY